MSNDPNTNDELDELEQTLMDLWITDPYKVPFTDIVPKAKAKIEALITRKQIEARITELELLRQDYDISMDFEPIENRIAELKGKEKEK